MPNGSKDTRLIAVPAAITLAVTLLRLAGERLHLSPVLFGTAEGGAALVGISWLVPLVGIWFGLRLGREEKPERPLAAAGLLVLAIALMPVAGVIAPRFGVKLESLTMLVIFAVAAVAATAIALPAWPRLGRVLLGYALAARVPVAVLMLLAIFGHWGTHYDPVLPKELSPMTRMQTWLWLGALPQLTIWIAYTVVVGSVFGLVAGAIAARRRPAARAAAA